MTRRGFTITELVLGLTVMGILGVALTRILMNDSRFVSKQDAMLSSRQAARAALNTIVSELSVVGDSSVVAATRDSLTVRVPIAFGTACRSVSGTVKVVTLLPVDSVAWANLISPGVFWRQRTGYVKRLTGTTTVASAAASDTSYCHQDSVRQITGGKLIRLTVASAAVMPESLSVITIYQRVTYKFAASTDLSGRIGLWRLPNGGTAEELVTPFDTSARFAYLMGGAKSATMTLTTSAVTGTGLDSIRGVELRLFAASENKPQGSSSYQMFPLKTRVRFGNKVS